MKAWHDKQIYHENYVAKKDQILFQDEIAEIQNSNGNFLLVWTWFDRGWKADQQKIDFISIHHHRENHSTSCMTLITMVRLKTETNTLLEVSIENYIESNLFQKMFWPKKASFSHDSSRFCSWSRVWDENVKMAPLLFDMMLSRAICTLQICFSFLVYNLYVSEHSWEKARRERAMLGEAVTNNGQHRCNLMVLFLEQKVFVKNN